MSVLFDVLIEKVAINNYKDFCEKRNDLGTGLL